MLNQNLTFFMNGKFNKLSNEYLIIKIGQFYQQLWNFEQVALFPLDISDMTRIEKRIDPYSKFQNPTATK